MKEKEEIEVVTGDASNLDISPVYEHLKIAKPKAASKKPKNIVVPKSKKELQEKKEEKENEND